MDPEDNLLDALSHEMPTPDAEEPQDPNAELPLEETPAPVAPPAFDEEALIQKAIERMTAAQQAPPQPAAAPAKQALPTWDEFEGSLDEFIALHASHAAQTASHATRLAIQEGNALAQISAQLPPEVASITQQWLDQLPPEQMQPGIAQVLATHALGVHQMNQIMKGGKGAPAAPKAVADSGVPGGGFTSPDDSQVAAAMKAAFPHLNQKELQEAMKNGRQ